MAGYSGTPLAKKLGIKSAAKLFTVAAPGHYDELLAPLPEDVQRELHQLVPGVIARDVLEAEPGRWTYARITGPAPSAMADERVRQAWKGGVPHEDTAPRGRLGAHPASPGSSGSRGSGTRRSSGVPGTLGSEAAGSSVPISTRVTFGKSRRAVPEP